MLVCMGTTTLMSLAEFEQLPSGPEQLNLLKGEVIQSAPPQNEHMVPPTWLRPDVSITDLNQPGDRYYEGAPLVVFEVVSEFNTAAHRATVEQDAMRSESLPGLTIPLSAIVA
jgi:Uma2 family endonuclease